MHYQDYEPFCLPLKKFKQCAYEALDGKDLLDGLFEFMGDSVVVPTGQEWEDEVMMPFLQRIISKQKEMKKAEQIRKKSKFCNILFILMYSKSSVCRNHRKPLQNILGSSQEKISNFCCDFLFKPTL